MTFVVLNEKRAADEGGDVAFPNDLERSVRSGRIASQPFLQVDDFRLRRVRNFTGASLREDDEIARLQPAADLQGLDYQKRGAFDQNEKRRAAFFSDIQPPGRANLDRAIDRAADPNTIQDFG